MAIDLEEKRVMLIRWFENATGLTTIWEDQDSLRPIPPYATLKIVSIPSVGVDEIRQRQDETMVDIVGYRRISVSSQVLGPNAMEIISCARLALSKQRVRDELEKADLHFQTSSDPQDLSQLLETIIEPRAQMDIIFGTHFTDEEDLSSIDSVEITGTVDDITTSEIVEVT